MFLSCSRHVKVLLLVRANCFVLFMFSFLQRTVQRKRVIIHLQTGHVSQNIEQVEHICYVTAFYSLSVHVLNLFLSRYVFFTLANLSNTSIVLQLAIKACWYHGGIVGCSGNLFFSRYHTKYYSQLRVNRTCWWNPSDHYAEVTAHKPAAKSELSLVESDHIFVQFNTQWVFGTALCIQILAVTMWKAQSQSSYAVNYVSFTRRTKNLSWMKQYCMWINGSLTL